MSEKQSSILKKVLYPLVAIGLLFWVYKLVDPKETWAYLKKANYYWVIFAMFLALMSHLVRALRWKMLIEPMGYETSHKTSFYAVIMGYTVNYFTPRVGEVARCALKSKTDNIPVDKLVGTVVTERVFDLIVTLLIAITAFFVQYELIGDFFNEQLTQNGGGSTGKLVLLGAVLVSGVIGLWVFSILKKRKNNHPIVQKIIDFVGGLLQGARSIFKLKNPGLFLFYTALIWVLYFATPYVVFLSLEGTSHLGLDATLTTLLVGTMALIIPAPGGIGSFHYFVPLGLSLYGIDRNLGTSYAIISHTSHMIMIFLVMGIIGIKMWLDKRDKQVDESPEYS